jgi:beta-N-acetylhexosaminidase
MLLLNELAADSVATAALMDGTGESSDPERIAAAGESLVERVALAMGRELALLGFDIDFAPVLDVHTNPANPIIGDRAFATEPELAAGLALAFARGLDRAGVLPCGKHFPGHGDTETDSHLELPRLAHDLDRLAAVELLPFRRAVAAGIPMLMSAHVVFAALDATVPATLSQRVITGLLRDELGFTGILVSDDLDMRAIADHIGIGEAAVAAVRAGCDALLLCQNPDHQRQARRALLAAARADKDFAARVRQSATRITAAKQRHAERAAAPPADTHAAMSRLAGVIKENAPLAAQLAATARSDHLSTTSST